MTQKHYLEVQEEIFQETVRFLAEMLINQPYHHEVIMENLKDAINKYQEELANG